MAENALPDWLEEALSDYIDGTIAPARLEELSGLLTVSATARQVYSDYLMQHAALADEHETWPALAALDLSLCELPDSPPQSKSGRLRIILAAAAAIAAAVLIVFGIGHLPHRGAVTATAAADAEVGPGFAIVGTDRVIWHSGSVREGWKIAFGSHVALDGGVVNLLGENGIEVWLEGPAEVVFVSSMHADLHSGKMTVKVPVGMAGYVVETAHARIEDLSTEFGITTGPLATETHVFAGHVRMGALADGSKTVLLASGEAGMIRTGEAEVEQVAAQPAAFASQFVARPIVLHGTGLGGKLDPYWQVQVPGASDWQPATVYNPGPGAPQSPVIPNSEQSGWIRPEPAVLPDRTLVRYRTAFSLEQFQPETLTLRVRHAADDVLEEIQLNGQTVWLETEDEKQLPYANSDRFRQVILNTPGRPGNNILVCIVRNGDTAYPTRDKSPTAFRAEVDATAVRIPLGRSR